MSKPRELKDRLFGAAVLKVSFRLRGEEAGLAFRAIYPGVLRDLQLEDAQVEQFISDNHASVEAAARGKT